MKKEVYAVIVLVERYEDEASVSVELFESESDAKNYRKSEMESYLINYDYDEDTVEELIEDFENQDETRDWFVELSSSGTMLTIKIQKKEIV